MVVPLKHYCFLGIAQDFETNLDSLPIFRACLPNKYGFTFWCNFKQPRSHKCCRECWRKTFSGENHYNWNPDRFGLRQKQLFHRRCCNLLFNTLQALGKKKNKKKKELLGYGPDELRHHLISHPNWVRVKKKRWDIDHFFPISAFVKAGIFDVKIINALDNLQPLLKSENIAKGDKYDKKAFADWLTLKGVDLSTIGVWS